MSCEELEQQRIEFQQEYDAAMELLAAAQAVLAGLVDPTPEELAAANALVAAAASLVQAATTNLMYNYWNRMMNGCIPGGMMKAISGSEKLKELAEKIQKKFSK